MDGTLLHLQRNSVHAQIIACIARQGLPGKPWFLAERPRETKNAKLICVLLMMQKGMCATVRSKVLATS